MTVDRERLLKGFWRAVKECVRIKTESLESRLSKVEAHIAQLDELCRTTESKRYRGTWKDGEAYAAGEFVTFSGSLWHAERDNTQRPGDGAWKLAVKKGKAERTSEIRL